MSSITAVPLQPIGKGSVMRLWLGVALLIAFAFALAWYGTRAFQPLGFTVIQEGTGSSPTTEDIVLVSYVGTLPNGQVFDQNAQAAMAVDDVVPGFSQGLQQMKRGGHYKLTIPPRLGYGSRARGPIPANSTLMFDVKLIDYKSKAEIQRLQAEMQRMQGAPQGIPGGAPGAMPPGAVPPGDLPPGAMPPQ